jgi:cytochrome c6
MYRRIVVAVAILALGAGITGCKKQEQQGANAPGSTSASAPAAGNTAESAGNTAHSGGATTAGGKSGAELYKQYCAACHPDGGNPMNAKKTLHKADMAANNVKSEDDIVKLMRNPGPGMTKFDENTIPDADAKAIAKYVQDTYNK